MHGTGATDETEHSVMRGDSVCDNRKVPAGE